MRRRRGKDLVASFVVMRPRGCRDHMHSHPAPFWTNVSDIGVGVVCLSGG